MPYSHKREYQAGLADLADFSHAIIIIVRCSTVGQRIDAGLLLTTGKVLTEAKRVLFICTGNSARSQMAEGFLRHYGKGEYEVASAGTKPSRVNPFAIHVMAEKGIDISHHTSDHVDKYMGQEFDFVITVCDNAHETCPYFPTNKTRLHWSFEDPAAATGIDEKILAEFRRIRDQIEAGIVGFLQSAVAPTEN